MEQFYGKVLNVHVNAESLKDASHKAAVHAAFAEHVTDSEDNACCLRRHLHFVWYALRFSSAGGTSSARVGGDSSAADCGSDVVLLQSFLNHNLPSGYSFQKKGKYYVISWLFSIV